MSVAEIIWLAVGFGGQIVFSCRFIVQWIASERKGESIVPVAFWYLSLVGSWLLLAYAIHKRDPVFFVGQCCGSFIYLRNLYLIHHHGWPSKQATEQEDEPAAVAGQVEEPRRQAA